MRDLRIESEHHAEGHAFTLAPLNDHLRDRFGSAGLGVLVTLVDTAGALVALPAAAPDWIATVDLSLRTIAPVTDGPAIAESRLVRAGKNVIVVGIDVYDGHGADRPDGSRPCGAGIMSFARIPGHVTRAQSRPGDQFGQRTKMALDDSGLRGPLHDRLGLRVVDPEAGAVEIDKTEYVSNSFGSVNGGVLGMIVQAAAETGLEAAGHAFVAVDVEMHYLAQTERGPVRTATRILRVGDDHAVCEVRVVDTGAGDRLLTLAAVTLVRS
jgi:uncharacterized protein (TIGR00369 family)